MTSLSRLLLWKLGRVNIAPWAMPGETAVLQRHAAGKRRLAEVGVWEGGTTRALREVMASDGVLFAIDPFPVGRLGISYQEIIAKGEVARVRNGSVVWLRTTGVRAAADARVRSAPLDFVFIDSEHTFEALQAEWKAWTPLASGIVAVHDVIGDPGQGSVRFAQEHIFKDPQFTLLETIGCLAVLQRNR